MNIKYTSIIVIIGLAIFPTTILISNAQLFPNAENETIDYRDTLSDTDIRKSFGYCPANMDFEILTLKHGIDYTIESCPISRIYIDNWDKLDDITKLSIVEELQSAGYNMEKE